MGIFHAFVDDADVELVGVEAAGEGLDTDRHSASLSRGRPGVLHGSLQLPAAGRARAGASGALDLGGARLSGRRTRALVPQGQRARHVRGRHRRRGARGFVTLSRLEGIIPALETAHAVAWVGEGASAVGPR